jgi:hypothetical protein
VKLVVGRKKDMELVRALIELGKLEIGKLETRYRETPFEEPDMFRAGRNLRSLHNDSTS